ncbi:Nicotinate-nucleotide pyrophosphorylase [carboxylating] [Poriferisphaera corsica]|uniref:nicotinate-nucleotide diphosphorylase (carboxylating) n=1 Tax=Poriferisphaera corsica TaxID=2528020 RepID=A0A517YV88_9BACT|nr:carboxylating nicotinate-nucleotide diphosphorylase [Poriferisphaera corsica]QDU34072.1 Nicotinate-nucleotide pyrophosphorylase [carboxylating] [Poriferisphaera corsica]
MDINLNDFVTDKQLDNLIMTAMQEDMGVAHLDVTSETFIPADLRGQASMVARETGKLAGIALLHKVAAAYSGSEPTDQIEVELLLPDGSTITQGDTVARFTGSMRRILSMERVALNLVTHLSGVASLTWQYAEKCLDTNAKIYDTRKTIPGLRGLHKYAVRCGGGASHRMGLYDAVLIKDNHIAHLGIDDLHQALTEAVKRAHSKFDNLKFIQVEVDTLNQLKQVLNTGIDMVLLDNMTNEQLREAVVIRDSQDPGVQLEASGRVNLQTVQDIAKTGVDRISVGALTHSAPVFDFGLDIIEQ